jgi:hypothetical protein
MIKIFLILFSLSFTQLIAQADPDYKPPLFNIGANGAYIMNWQSSAFTELPGIPNGNVSSSSDNLQFTGGSGGGFSIGANFGLPFSNSMELMIKANYFNISSSETFNEFIGYAGGANLTEVTVEHLMETTFNLVKITPGVIWKPFDGMPFKIGLGFDLSYILSTSFNQSEQLTGAAVGAGITFADIEQQGGTHWNDQTGSIPETPTLNFGVNLGVGYDYKLSDKMSVTPEIIYNMPFNSLNNKIDWTYSGIGGGITFYYTVYGKSQYEKLNEQRIKDSLERYEFEQNRREDSIANYLAERKRINDSIAEYKALVEEKRIQDSLALYEKEQQRIKDSLIAAREMENKTPEKIPDFSNATDKYNCCTILFHSGYDRKVAEDIIAILRFRISELNKKDPYFKKNPIKEIKIDEITEKDGKMRFRVLSNCFGSASEAEYILIESGFHETLEELVRSSKIPIYPSYKCN